MAKTLTSFSEVPDALDFPRVRNEGFMSHYENPFLYLHFSTSSASGTGPSRRDFSGRENPLDGIKNASRGKDSPA
jgi:hypothetical protein